MAGVTHWERLTRTSDYLRDGNDIFTYSAVRAVPYVYSRTVLVNCNVISSWYSYGTRTTPTSLARFARETYRTP